MDKDRVKGTINDVVGNAKRHIGNLTGNTGTQVEGTVQQVKGKIQNTWGKAKDAVRDAQAGVNAPPETAAEADLRGREIVAAEDRNII